MKRIAIEKGWQLFGARLDSPIDVKVPGCVHTDLRSANLIPDMFYRDNNRSLGWIEESDWTYNCSFMADACKGAELLFEGLDTYADVYLNGTRVGSADDMFIPHSFPVGELLRDGENSLEVRFRSPIREVEDCPPRKGAFTTERINTRRIQCTYSWDWVDRFVTMGIFRPVYICYPNGADIESVYVYTETIDDFGAQIWTKLSFKNNLGAAADVARVEIFAPNGECVAHTELYADMRCTIRRFDIASPELWYPAGHGEQPLYRIRVTVGENVHEESFGIRTVRLLQLTDKVGSEYYNKAKAAQDTAHGRVFSNNEEFSGFKVIVNGKPILCMGANWVPCEPFPSAESDEKIELLCERAKEMGVNILRVWGGGIFEKPAFYSACDRLGIMVVQDFLMACGTYPEKEEWFINALRRESEYAVKYLRNHPSLVWWHGDNENAVDGSDTQKDYIGRDSAILGIAGNVYKHDWSRQFLPSSPFGGNTYGSVTVGTTHTTNFLSQIFEYFDTSDCTDYKEYLGGFAARFISEEGVFGAVSRPSMLKFMTEDDLINDESERILEYHTKSNPALKTTIFKSVTSFAKKAFGAPKDGEDKFFKYKYAQCEWVRIAFEAFRRNVGYCNGLVFWMFNDCWPAALGWAFVDYYSLPKPAFYTFKRLSKNVTASVTEESGCYAAYVCTDREMSGSFILAAKTVDIKSGKEKERCTLCGELAGYAAVRVELPIRPSDGEVVVVDLEYDGGADRCSYKRGRLEICPCHKGVRVVCRTADSITLKAEEYVHILELEGEHIFSDNYFTMMAGESRTVAYRPAERAESAEISVTAYTLE